MKQLLGLLMLLAGAALLGAVALVWFFPMLTSPAPQKTAVDARRLEDLPPALNPVAPRPGAEAAAFALPQVISAALQGLGGGETAVLLPESPPAQAETAVSQAAAPEAAATDPGQPLRIIIPALGIDAPVQPVGLEARRSGSRAYSQWGVPDAYAAGWHNTSAPLGRPGNTVLNGHNNVHGALFGDLATLAIGEQIVLAGREQILVYRVTQSELIPERDLTLRERVKNARWIAPTDDERLTLVTCWPKATNSHRLIVVARPLAGEG